MTLLLSSSRCFLRNFNIFRRRMSSSISTNLVWVDCEMTGLNLEKDTLLEVAAIITDKDLEILTPKGFHIVIHQPDSVLNTMNEWCIEQHGKSGLTLASKCSEIDIKDAQRQLIDFVQPYIENGQCPLAGNSVGQDARFLYKYMPEFMNILHYRIVDTSSIKELVRRWNPNLFNQIPVKKRTHRALDDIKESIAELQFYKANIFDKTYSS